MNCQGPISETAAIESHSRQFKIGIGEMMLKKQRFYLDTKYWIFMREASLGKAPEVQTQIYNTLRKLVETGSDEMHKSERVRLLSNAIYNAFDQNKIGKELPFIRIMSGLHAYVRYNRDQRYKVNDLPDFSHAACGLPYCDAFFTEKPLHDWICNNLLKLNEVYGTKVLWKEEDVLKYLESIVNDAKKSADVI